MVHDEKLGNQIYLDMTSLSHETWKKKLPDLRQEIIDYLNIDPAITPVPIEPAIHYFMGGIDVDKGHHTNIQNLYAAGECCSQYHGANRLGGNSLLGAIYGGMTAAQSLIDDGYYCHNGYVIDTVTGEYGATGPYDDLWGVVSKLSGSDAKPVSIIGISKEEGDDS